MGSAQSAFVVSIFLCLETVNAQNGPPLVRSDFTPIAVQGFGDRQNTWAWSMEWFQGKLYVGTNRAYECVVQASIANILPSAYPPSDPDIQCTPSPSDLPLQAEIWSWTPATNTWARVFQSPNDVPIPGTNKFTARDIGFRGMYLFQESDGTQALYVGGCSAKAIYSGAPQGRLLRTTDGVTFTPVPQNPGTFMGGLGKTCFRGGASLNGKLYVVATDYKGEGVIIESADPKVGDNSFRQITPQGALAYEVGSYNGFLYVTFVNNAGFDLYKTSAVGTVPYTFAPIFTNGGYKQPKGNPIGLSMVVFNSDLYVGGDSVQTTSTVFCAVHISCVQAIFANGGAELFRVHADDSWDLIVGQPRSTPAGMKTPLSGWGPGFDWILNQHMWRMEVFDSRLYIGTYDLSTELRNASGIGPGLVPELGFDLWYSSDGIHFNPVDIRGFEDKFNYGVRSIKATPNGLMIGTANPFYGLEVFRGSLPN